MGNFEVELTTDRLKISMERKKWRIEADYRIGLNTMPPSYGKLEIHIEEA